MVIGAGNNCRMSVAILGLGIAALQGCGQGPFYGHTEAVKVLIKEHMATQNKTALAVLALGKAVFDA